MAPGALNMTLLGVYENISIKLLKSGPSKAWTSVVSDLFNGQVGVISVYLLASLDNNMSAGFKMSITTFNKVDSVG